VIKWLTQWNPRPGVDDQEALRGWGEEHPELVLRVPGIRGYVQNISQPLSEGTPPPHAGLGEVHFDDLEAADRAGGSPQRAAVIEDARMFMDLQHVVVAWAAENPSLRPSQLLTHRPRFSGRPGGEVDLGR
jgi:uncharacterized protein (TIGR02118 family)